MRKGHAAFVFSAIVLPALGAVGCGGADAPAQVGGAGGSGGGGGASGASGRPVEDASADDNFDSGRGGRAPSDGGGGTRFFFDVQVSRDPNCPPAIPVDSDSCTQAATCAYPTGGCTCQHDPHSDAGRTWHCQEFPARDGGFMTCENGTANGDHCDVQGRFCSTGDKTCGCFGTDPSDRKWTCF
jgi:hypothetical protein